MRRSSALLALLVVLAGCGGGEARTTSTEPFVPNGKTGIAAIGDFGVGGDAEERIGAVIRAELRERGGGTLLTLGDNDYSESSDDFSADWQSAFGWTRSDGVRVVGTLGNHDVILDGGRYQFDELGIPAPYYRRSIGDVDLFVLDSTRPTDAAQRAWLERELAASTAPWKIGAFHHPAYNCGRHSNQTGMRPHVDLMREHGVRLVLTGHDHNYQRFELDGLTQVVAGNGGASLYELAGCPDDTPEPAFARDDTHGFVFVSVGEQQLEVSALSLAGETIDRFTIER